MNIVQYIRLHKGFIFCVLLWAVLVSLFFAPSVFGNKVIAPLDCLECVFRPFADKPIEQVHNNFVCDSVSQYLPYKWAMKESLELDGYIGWNPYTYNGSAQPENTMTSPGDLHNFLYGLLPFWTAWDMGVILQFFIAGLGMIVLLRFYKIPIFYSILAAVSFAFYSQFILWIYHKWVGAMVWAPFLTWALIKYKSRLVNVPAIIFIALMWRTGSLQSCTFVFMLVACIWGALVWKTEGNWLPKKEFYRITVSFLLTGIVGALLSLDVFVDTLPRMDGCKTMPFRWGVSHVATMFRSLFPLVAGVPQTIDFGKIVGSGLMDIRFGGGIVFILALVGLFNSKAPRIAKVIMLTSLVVASSPLCTYVYSRSTVVMALGMSWLATWQLYWMTQYANHSSLWRRIGAVLVSVMTLWLIVSVIVLIWREPLTIILNDLIQAQLDSWRAGRSSWYALRAERVLSQVAIWDWHNLLLSVGLLVGVYCCYKIAPENRKNAIWVALITVITYAELVIYASTWVTYASEPEGPYIYEPPVWMSELKEHIDDGSVAIHNPIGDGDFWCQNTLSAYGVRLASGYETFQPKYLRPLSAGYDPIDCAKSGISHILTDTKWKVSQFPGWNCVMKGKDFALFENPEYKGRFFVDEDKVIKPNRRTYNRIYLTIPQDAKKLTVLESYHRGWKAYYEGREVEIVPTERGGMSMTLPQTDPGCDLLLEFKMPYHKLYYSIMGVTAFWLLFVAYRQAKYAK